MMAKGYYYYTCLKDYDTAVRYFEQARQFLPNNSRIPESLAYVARRRGQWDQSESYFNEAERLDPRNVSLLTEHGLSYSFLRRFPEALRKLDQVLNITPDDVDVVVEKVGIAQAEGDLRECRGALGSASSASPTILTSWKHWFTKQPWSDARCQSFLGYRKCWRSPIQAWFPSMAACAFT